MQNPNMNNESTHRSAKMHAVCFLLCLCCGISFGQSNVITRTIYADYADMLTNSAPSNLIKCFDVTIQKDALALFPPEAISNILVEVRSKSFKELTCNLEANQGKKELRPDFVVAVCERPTYFLISFGVTQADTNSQVFIPFSERVRFYVNARRQGHSSNYVAQALMERGAVSAWPADMPKMLRDTYWVPRDWIKKVGSHWIVVDGVLAWRYSDDGSEQVRDAQEYDPKLLAAFTQAELEVRNQGAQSEFVHDQLLKIELLKRYQIRWTTPAELTPLAR